MHSWQIVFKNRSFHKLDENGIVGIRDAKALHFSNKMLPPSKTKLGIFGVWSNTLLSELTWALLVSLKLKDV